MVTAVTFGIVVDDTIHFLSKYLRARRELGLDSPAAVRFAFRTVGHALWTTTAVLAAQGTIVSKPSCWSPRSASVEGSAAAIRWNSSCSGGV